MLTVSFMSCVKLHILLMAVQSIRLLKKKKEMKPKISNNPPPPKQQQKSVV